MKTRSALLPLYLLLLLSCAGPQEKTMFKTAKSGPYPVKIQSVLVLNGFQDLPRRAVFEDAVVAALREKGVRGVSSYTFARAREPITDPVQLALSLAAENALDVVLINTPLASGIGPYGTYEQVYIYTETSVYDVKSRQLLIATSARSMVDPARLSDAVITRYASDIVTELSRNDMF